MDGKSYELLDQEVGIYAFESFGVVEKYCVDKIGIIAIVSWPKPVMKHLNQCMHSGTIGHCSKLEWVNGGNTMSHNHVTM